MVGEILNVDLDLRGAWNWEEKDRRYERNGTAHEHTSPVFEKYAGRAENVPRKFGGMVGRDARDKSLIFKAAPSSKGRRKNLLDNIPTSWYVVLELILLL
jgi:hypothetical protein